MLSFFYYDYQSHLEQALIEARQPSMNNYSQSASRSNMMLGTGGNQRNSESHDTSADKQRKILASRMGDLLGVHDTSTSFEAHEGEPPLDSSEPQGELGSPSMTPGAIAAAWLASSGRSSSSKRRAHHDMTAKANASPSGSQDRPRSSSISATNNSILHTESPTSNESDIASSA